MPVNDIVIEFEDKQKMIIEGCQTLLVYPDQGFAEVTKNGYKMYFNFNKIRYIGRKFDIEGNEEE